MIKEEQKFKEFIAQVKKVKGNRKHQITNSYGVIDGFNYYKTIKPNNKEYNITIQDYRKLIRQINKRLAEALLEEGQIILPHALGRLEIRKYKPSVKFKNGKILNTMPIDWNSTLSLWHQDEESRNNKQLVRKIESWIYRIHYNRYKADYSNKSFYKFHTNRNLKLKIKNKINEGNLEAFLVV